MRITSEGVSEHCGWLEMHAAVADSFRLKLFKRQVIHVVEIQERQHAQFDNTDAAYGNAVRDEQKT